MSTRRTTARADDEVTVNERGGRIRLPGCCVSAAAHREEAA
jgi:hypothetical protein